jgi:hypothetical protein
MLPFRRRSAARLLGLGTVGWLYLAFGRTERIAQRLEVPEAEVRALGARDTVSAAALLLSRKPGAAIWARILFDLSDTWRFGRQRPEVAVWTAGFAALGLLALLGRSGR